MCTVICILYHNIIVKQVLLTYIIYTLYNRVETRLELEDSLKPTNLYYYSDTMTIKDLGRWENLEIVQRYTRSVTFQDSLRLYKPPLR